MAHSEPANLHLHLPRYRSGLSLSLAGSANPSVTAIDVDFGGRPDAAATLAEMKRFRSAVIEKI
jgi:hypothetical protein